VIFAEGCGSNINDYCSLDLDGSKPVSQMTLGEKEQTFLEALSVGWRLSCSVRERRMTALVVIM